MGRHLIFPIICMLAGCAPQVTTTKLKSVEPLKPSVPVHVISRDANLPRNAEQVGTVRIGDSGLTIKCDYATVINIAKKEARNTGGNILALVSHKTPDLWSSCHRIYADIYRATDAEPPESVVVSDPRPVTQSSQHPRTWKSVAEKKDYKIFGLTLSGGWSRMIAKLPGDLPKEVEKYSNELRNGFHLDADIKYYLSDKVGLGVKYRRYNTRNEIANIGMVIDENTVRFGKMSDDITVQLIGPSLGARLPLGQGGTGLTLNYALGIITFKNNATLIDEYVVTGTTAGSCFSAGIESWINEQLGWGLGASLMSGTLMQMTVDDGTRRETIKLEEEEYENISRLDISARLMLRF